MEEPMNRQEVDGEPILTAEQMREADRLTIEQDQVPVAELMERAGQAVAEAVIRSARDGGRIVVVCGNGNNGGDGFVAARLLRNRRIPVTAIPLVAVEDLKGEVARQAELARQAGVKVRPATGIDDLGRLQDWLTRAAVVVDAIFGTGLARPVEGWVSEAVACINRSDRTVLSVDIASGIDSDCGAVLGSAVRADFTLPIAAYKWGHWLGEGRDAAGRLLPPAPIGISHETLGSVMSAYPAAAARSHLISRAMIRQAFPDRPLDAHKGDFGRLWIFGGSQGYTGAPRLAASGAQAVGTGLISIACPEDVYAIVASASLEVMVHPQQEAPWHHTDAIVAGPGWGREHVHFLGELLDSEHPVVLDADALNMIASDAFLVDKLAGRKAVTVMTPHPGEAGRLLDREAGEVQAERLATALELATKYHCWVVLKGCHTLICSPQRHLWLCPFGSPNLAVAGTGDVLSGMIGGLLAAGIGAERAIISAVGLHAVAGEQQGWHRAGELEEVVVATLRKLREQSVE